MPKLKFGVSVLAAGLVSTALGAFDGSAALRYRAKLHLRGYDRPWETTFTLKLGPAVKSANRVQRPRLLPWHLEATQVPGGVPQALVLARLERLLYVAGPTEATEAQNLIVHHGDRPCRIWSVRVPRELGLYAYLVEVAPGLLVLTHLSGRPERGDWVSVEIQLETLALKGPLAPAEQGQNLLATLQKWASEPVRPVEASDDVVTVE